MSKTICFDTKDWASVVRIMDEHGHAKTMLFGHNAENEAVWISPFPDRVTVRTLQSNGWARLNTYWRDGTREETFDGRWR